MQEDTNLSCFFTSNMPVASAVLKGNRSYPLIRGVVNFYIVTWQVGLFVEAEFSNLPNFPDYSPRFFGFHIHENGDCRRNFENTGPHLNPTGADHPYHIGDLPPVLNSNGYGFLAFYDTFLSLELIKGRSIVLHGQRDDFKTQPSGDSGDKIACGIINTVKDISHEAFRDDLVRNNLTVNFLH